ncbi:MAG TPA: hypothetical protein PL010_13020 [Flavobacteriales bacterium]|nr:hypothetical protein [Flavobacteriales bacterium]HNI05540.1 hypothetical protein [Flavobacteriales bacterium]HNK69037.1 hypothetical protein [Flavobacteriales bacterium]HNO06101.1 hypothetical protein [Flavobacteriales bacterium]HRT54272.1 hypothetical protein [Flavobacteriales bacterium]
MSERWKFVDEYAHFVSFAVVGWIDVFTRADYAEFLLKNLDHCRRNKGLAFDECVRYVRDNPVPAGLVTHKAAYTWSSANPDIHLELEEA